MSESNDTSLLPDALLSLSWSSFLIRCYRDGENGAWRGEIIHLETQEKRRIGAYSQIAEFLFQHIPGFEPTRLAPTGSENLKE